MAAHDKNDSGTEKHADMRAEGVRLGAGQGRASDAIPTFVRQARKALGETGETFGARFERSKGAVSQWELGVVSPSLGMLQEMAAASGVAMPSSMPEVDIGFGADAVKLVRAQLREAQRRLPATLLSALQVPTSDLRALADFLVMLDDLLARYPDSAFARNDV